MNKWKRKVTGILAMALVCTVVFAGCNGAGKEGGQSDKEPDAKAVVLEAAQAKLSEGEVKGVKASPKYDKKNDVIKDMITGAGAAYTVGKDVDGAYDIYLEIAKTQYDSGSTHYNILVNGESCYTYPDKSQRANEKATDLYEKGVFLMSKNVKLKSGDVITVVSKDGYAGIMGNGKAATFIPAIGNVLLYEAGEKVPVGYEGEEEKPWEKTASQSENDVLAGKTICWLGSSVTFGMSSGGYAIPEMIEEAHEGTVSLKYAISGTTLANVQDISYVARLKADVDPKQEIDLMVVQLSTNDALPEKGLSLGTVSESKEADSFDDTTVIGAMETIIAYVQQTWDCPVVFYTGTKYDNATYGQMVDALYKLQEKWGIGIVDLWNNEEMSAIVGTEQYDAYMNDGVHPNEVGYKEWWLPEFEKYLAEFLAK